MKIKALKNFFIPNKGGYKAGGEYDVTDGVAVLMMKRGLAQEEKVKKEEVVETEEQKPKKNKKY